MDTQVTASTSFLHRKRPDQQSSPFLMDLDSAAVRFQPVELIPVRDGGGHEKRKVVGEVDFFSAHDVQKVINGGKKEDHGRRDVAAAASKLNLDVNTGLNLLTANTGSDQSTVDDGISPNSDEKKRRNEVDIKLMALQMELERMNEENQRLRGMLAQVSNNYSSLQLHLMTMMQQQNNRPQAVLAETHNRNPADKIEEHKPNESNMVPRQFMDLGPVTDTTDEPSQSSSGGRTTRSGSPRNNNNNNQEAQSNKVMSCQSEINSQLDHQDQLQNRDGREGSSDRESPAWIANKLPKLAPPPTVEQSAEATMRKARVSVRARSEAPMITDGCQWRKYGQKMAKGNPCPRAYYRCTMAAGCPVRKQVQRCAEDRSILTTTYEGNHNHPLPPAAMAMASTTSAAATMLLSGSMASADGLLNSNFLARTMLPCSSSMATISASAPFPTVTLDLTQNPSPLQFQRPPTHFSLPFPSGPSPAMAASPVAALGQMFGQSLYNQTKFSGLQASTNIDAAQFMHQQQHPAPVQNPSLVDTVSAATAAITADPNFTAALAAAITSIIGSGGLNQGAGNSSSPATDNNNNNSNSITSK